MSKDWQNALQSLLDSGDIPEGEPVAAGQSQSSAQKQKGKLVINIEKKGRGGKTATIISGFTLEPDELNGVAAKLKSKLGTGGSARGGEILIQGDRREDVRRLLQQMGYRI